MLRLSLGLALAALSCRGGGTTPTDEDGSVPVEGDGVGPEVVSVTPEPDAVGVPVDAPIVVRFSMPVAPSTGTATCSVPCEAMWNAAGDELTLVHDVPFDWLSLVEVQVSGFEDTEDDAMAAPFSARFQTDLRERVAARPREARSWRFVEVAQQAGFSDEPFDYDSYLSLRPTTAGGTCGDYDGDGYVDVYLGRGNLGSTHLYRNLGDGTFVETTDQAGVRLTEGTYTAPSFVDRDADGDLDLLASHFEGGTTHFWNNQGDGTFTDEPDAAGLVCESHATFSVIWGDVDADLDLDVFFARFNTSASDPRFLFLNDGDGTFTEASAQSGLFFLDIQQSFTPNFADMDDDGYPELLIASDHELSVYLRNAGDGTFMVDREVALTDENGMGATIGDFDNDGDLDWFVSAIYDPDGESEKIWGTEGNRLYQNQGDGFFVDVSEAAGVRDGHWGWGACAQDFDLDGQLDILHVNGWRDPIDAADEEYGKDMTALFRNNGDGTFTNVAQQHGIVDTSQGRGVMCFDAERDGDIDFLSVNFGERPLFYRNDTPPGAHFLNVRLEALAPNTEGVGARVYATVGGVTQMRELRAGANYMSNDPVEAHFGLGEADVVDELRVRWPDRTETVVSNVRADRFVVLTQQEAR